ncbi:uncharacterized protein [Haliotis cracherodii]|uniref:uncharacterized protein n=1 Tax=Haliotis cracherodii TaxID=6455 RepID=UPI0039ECDFFD
MKTSPQVHRTGPPRKVVTLANAECHCDTVTACSTFPSTPCTQVGSPDRCQQGWFGSYCQTQNIALGRSANQSSTYIENNQLTGNKSHHFEAKYAVDGRATNDFYSKPLTCTHTDRGVQTWTVYLDTANTDQKQRIKLYLRNDSDPERNQGMKIFVGEQLCTQWPTTIYPPAIADVRCQQPLTGNTLTIQTSIFLTLCEVQIFVCSDGWFDEECDKQCHCSQNTEVCDKITGQCLSGCAPGYMGIHCQSACSDGRHGHHCQSECGQCKENLPCNKINGTCDQGCQPGFQEPTCKECVDGMYGDDCMSRCGQCKDSLTCDKSSGECPEGLCPATPGCLSREAPVVATLGTLLVLAVIALLTSIFYIRRLKCQPDALQKKPEDNYISLDEKTKDPVMENTYEHIDSTIPYANAGEDR